MKIACCLSLIACLLLSMIGAGGVQAQPSPTDAASLGLTELSDDMSRQQLFAEIQATDRKGSPGEVARADEAVQTFNLVGPFRFPGDAAYDSTLNKPRINSLFGVDVSHYTSTSFPIELLSVRNVLFLYMKATQGSTGLDGKFASFWKRAGDLPQGRRVHRGAYHFLSACQGTDCRVPAAKWGKLQADTFIKVINANGGLLATDMPPVVDLEWDKASSTGPDRWQNRSAEDIEGVVDAFVTEVQAQLGRTPMIYTARSWWNGRMGTTLMTAAMKSATWWLADYSKSSRAGEDPRTISNTPWALWQFTDSGTMATGFNSGFDTNIWKGAPSEFYRRLAVQEFSP